MGARSRKNPDSSSSDHPIYKRSPRMRYTIVTLLFIALLTGCGTTGVVKLEQNYFMVSTKSAKVGFVNAA
jgi:hypothetical protein